ncbi:MAG: hypothetical protein OEY05_16480 [Paracoccaceae bacterium]|nr:hypothetical protein [Paracoccaceae bacterium]
MKATEFLRTIAFRLSRLARPRPTDNDALGILVAPEQRAQSVVLIWSLGIDAAGPELSRAITKLEGGTTLVVVTDAFDFLVPLCRGCQLEALPNAKTRAPVHSPDWPTYLERRIARIRESWGADAEVVLGLSPAAFVEAAGTGT